METNRHPHRPEAATDEPASPFNPEAREARPPAHPEERPGLDPGEVEAASRDEVDRRSTSEDPPHRIGWLEGHLPDLVDPLVPRHPDTAFTETRRLRRDGWTPEKKRLFLERFAECGVIVEACEAAGMSARSVYNLAGRDPLFAAGMEAARVLARPRLADEGHSRALNGVVERIYKDGMIVAERHRYDNRLTMAVLTRLDARIDRAEEKGAPHLALVERWDDYLAALEEDRREDGLALLAPAPAAAAEVHGQAPHRELHELHRREEAEMQEPEEVDRHEVWEEDDGWWTDYPPPAGFDGDEHGEYGDFEYRRALSPDEQAVIDAEEAEEKAEARAKGEAQRAAYFALAEPPPAPGERPSAPRPATGPPRAPEGKIGAEGS